MKPTIIFEELLPLSDFDSAGQLDPPLRGVMYSAACVALSRHHQSPGRFTCRQLNKWDEDYRVEWERPDGSQAKSYQANEITERAAECVAFSVMVNREALRVVGRAEHSSGADWILVPADSNDLEESIALEVSGIDILTVGNSIRRRLTAKVQQIRRGMRKGKLNWPAYALVVAFSDLEVEIAHVELLSPDEVIYEH